MTLDELRAELEHRKKDNASINDLHEDILTVLRNIAHPNYYVAERVKHWLAYPKGTASDLRDLGLTPEQLEAAAAAAREYGGK
jgi:hypothetical protein